MRIFDTLRRFIRNSDKISASIEAMLQGIDNQQKQLNELKGLLGDILGSLRSQVELQTTQLIITRDQLVAQRDQAEMQKAQLVVQRDQAEMQRALLVMQRDYAEAIDALSASIEIPTVKKHHELEQ